LGIFKFPAFLEFDWKENLLKLFIIDRNSGKELYSYTFRDVIERNKGDTTDLEDREKAIPQAIIGIEMILNSLRRKDNLKTDKIQKGKLTIIFEQGGELFPNITYALVVGKELNSLGFFLKQIKMQFEGFFKEILLMLPKFGEGKEELFSSFDVIINNIIRK